MSKLLKPSWIRCVCRYEDVFIPNVLEHQKRNGITGKVVLLLDNAPSHPQAQQLNAINEQFEVIYLPPNVTALVQPQDQGIIATVKKLYRSELLHTLLLNDEKNEEKNESSDAFLKSFNLRDSFHNLNKVWSSISYKTLRNPWKKMLGDIFDMWFKSETVTNNEATSDELAPEIVEFFSRDNRNNGLSESKTQETIINWLEEDENDCGWEASTIEEIVESVKAQNAMTEEYFLGPSKVADVHEVDLNEQWQLEDAMEISAEEAHEAACKLQKWLKQNNYTAEQLSSIEKLRHVTVEAIAAEKTFLSL